MISRATTLSGEVDKVFLLIFGISFALMALITVTMVYFLIRYNRKRNPTPVNVKETPVVEALFLAVPTVLVLTMFYYGSATFRRERAVPPDAMVVNVYGRQWSWLFEYDNGLQGETLKLPVGKPVRLLLNSRDVIHGFYIPAFRLKEDVVPGRQNYVWFQPMEEGSYDILCTQYCGLRHSYMLSKVEVMPEEDFRSWYSGKVTGPTKGPGMETEPPGLHLLRVKGCVACHSLDGSPLIGPTYRGLFGKKEVVITEGREHEAVVDESFIRMKVNDPNLSRVKGFPPVMPSFKGQLTDDEIAQIADYLKTLR